MRPSQSLALSIFTPCFTLWSFFALFMPPIGWSKFGLLLLVVAVICAFFYLRNNRQGGMRTLMLIGLCSFGLLLAINLLLSSGLVAFGGA